MDMIIRGIRIEAEGIRSFELVPADGATLAPWQPGAHVQVSVNGSTKRAYSLCNRAQDSDCYRIAVKLEPASRGGSQAMHQLQVGQRIAIDAPRNAFALDEGARRHVLLAGGIGITPLLSMLHALRTRGADAALHYFVRGATHAAFSAEIGEQGQLHAGLDAVATASALADIVSAHAGDAHTTYYVCGPEPFMAAVEAALKDAGVAETRLRSERFGAAPAAPSVAPPAATGAACTFRVRFARCGSEFDVPADETIIGAARANGLDIPTSCEQGVCGACLSDVIDGSPEHHDDYLSAAERAGGKMILPCVSRCSSRLLVLDR
ncbi:PDR/VanB family oxidoreductase [Uliginosibacterium sp. H1]|uniref:PDR/VanB family oxidoreductase n=1 Tax=Uliginosibacterium sp. H1 TaxID=3114757 RepID=UPI002E17A283|nr:PDR/VanB family oxidoreductase [Uliginosibacterium sp. H1]